MAAVARSKSPPGITTVAIDFDFVEAFEFIKKKANAETLGDHWHGSFLDAVDACSYRRTEPDDVSISWFCAKFLDVLWGLLCMSLLQSISYESYRN